jgi:hypothetical protein
MLPFTTEQFLDTFGRYNQAIWPLQIVAYILGLVAVSLALRPTGLSDRMIGLILAAFWLWTGLVYHAVYFREINCAAVVFGALFVVQGALWLLVGVVRPRLAFRAHPDLGGLVGALFIAYALVGFPLLGLALGQSLPRMLVFGVTPCPVTILTFGLLLWTERPVPRLLLVIPLVWSLLGVSAAISLDVGEDIGLVVAGLLGTALLLWRDHLAVGGGVLPQRAVRGGSA